MSNEEQQRIIREQGSRPAEAEKQESARESREAFGRQQADDPAGGQAPEDPSSESPAAEDDPDRPVPRR